MCLGKKEFILKAFYNPNIHPYDEFIRRKENVKKLSEIKNVL